MQQLRVLDVRCLFASNVASRGKPVCLPVPIHDLKGHKGHHDHVLLWSANVHFARSISGTLYPHRCLFVAFAWDSVALLHQRYQQF